MKEISISKIHTSEDNKSLERPQSIMKSAKKEQESDENNIMRKSLELK